jgi:two-component system sensor histidine kinase TctE
MAHDRKRFDLQRLAQTLTAEWVPRALRAHIDLGLDDSATAPVWIEANELLVREALTNLIDNALHYAGAGSQVTVRVTSDDTHTPPQALLEVADTGPGLSLADRERVFERFVRASEVGQGCGLVLAIVKEIVERHHGDVRLSAVHPHGLCVSIHLPLSTAPAN